MYSGKENAGSDDESIGPLTGRQKELVRYLQNLNPETRHTMTLMCRGTEPWKIDRVLEHIGSELRPKKR